MYMEGSLWHETQDGEFVEQTITPKGFRRVSDGYMHSIARGAPNLEEIGFYTYTVLLSEFVSNFWGADLVHSSSFEGEYCV